MGVKKVRLLKNLLIPAGTVFENIDGSVVEHISGCFEHTVGLTKDSFGSFVYNVDEGDKELKEWFAEVS